MKDKRKDMIFKKSVIKKFFLLIGFLICFCLLFSMVQNILRKKIRGSSDFIHSVYSLDKNTTDVIFIGSSHAYYSISSNELWGEYGIPATVMASSSQAICNSYYLLKDILKYQKPKVVVVETFGAVFSNLYMAESRMRQVLDAMPMSLTKLEAIHNLCKDYSFPHKMTYLFPISLYHSRWQELKPYDFYQKNTYLRGTSLTFEYRDYTAYKPKKNKVKKKDIFPGTVDYLQKLIDITRENDIQLVFYASPVAAYKKSKYKSYYGMNLSMEDFANEHNIPFLFMEKLDDLNFDYEKNFMDSEHVNYFGQKMITEYIAEYLKSNYDLPDRRGDSRYEQYQKDYEKYQITLAEKLAENPDGIYMGRPGQAVVEEDE